MIPRTMVRWLLAMVLVVLTGAVAAPTAHAETTYPVQLEITSVNPVGGPSSGEVTITGTATNTSDKALRGVQVYIWRSADPVDGLGTLSDVLRSDPSYPLGQRLYLDQENYFNITTFRGSPSEGASTTKETFEPGESVQFTVSGALSGDNSLGFTRPRTTYILGLQVKVGEQYRVQGRARTLWTTAPAKSVKVAQVVRLASRPSLLHDHVLADDHLAEELTGRLEALLDLAQQPGTTVLLDPALYDELVVMSKGYTVHGSKASTAAGQKAAQQALVRIAPLLTSGRIYRTLYGSPDPVVARSGDRPDVLTKAATLPKTHPMAALPLAVAPRGLVADNELLSFIGKVDPALVLASNLTGLRAVQVSGKTTVVRVSADAWDGALSPDPRTTPAQVAARLQAQQLATDEEGSTLVTVATTLDQARAALAPAPWRDPVTLQTLVAAEKAPIPANFASSLARGSTAPLEQSDRIERALHAWGGFTDQDAAASTLAGQFAPRAISTDWAGDTRAAVAWAHAVSNHYSGPMRGKGVTLKVTRNIVTSSDNQEVPVTITNTLAHSVKVKAVFTSENPQRLEVAESKLTTVAAGETETVRVRVNAHANGAVGVQARLVTATGDPVGAPQEMTVTATQMGQVGWLIILGSGVVLLAATGLRIRQVQHERARGGQSSAEPSPAEELELAPPVKAPMADLAPADGHEGDDE